MRNLPGGKRKQDYNIQNKCRICSKRPSGSHERESRLGKLAALLPINIICVQARRRRVVHGDASAFICRNFDMTLCSVVATVTPDLQFRLTDYGNAFAALRARTIVLRNCAFTVSAGSFQFRWCEYRNTYSENLAGRPIVRSRITSSVPCEMQ